MRSLLRAVVILAFVAIVGVLLLGYWAGSGTGEGGATGTTGAVDLDRARERGAELGERAATAAADLTSQVGEASLTGKIKAKMTLDDLVSARAIDVSTEGTTVTLRGRVSSAAERDRAMSLARETDGVTRVVDELHVEQ